MYTYQAYPYCLCTFFIHKHTFSLYMCIYWYFEIGQLIFKII